jgi:hypothetical protein
MFVGILILTLQTFVLTCSIACCFLNVTYTAFLSQKLFHKHAQVTI